MSTKHYVPKYSFQDLNKQKNPTKKFHVQKISCQKIPCPTKKSYAKNPMSNTNKQKNPTKIPCPTKNPMPKIKFFPCPTKNSMSNQKKKKNSLCLTKIPWPKKFYAKNPMSNIKIHTTTKYFHTHTHKNFHTHEIRLTHSNKISTLIKSEFVQSSLHIKFSWFQYP